MVALYNTVREIIMKKFRPYCTGFIVLYVLCFLCVGDAVYSLISQAMGTANEYMTSFSMFSYLIAILAFFYVKMYAASKIVITDTTMRMVNPVYIKPAPGAKRAMFIYRSGETDIKLMDKTFKLEDLEKYGWIDDLGYARLDASGVSEKNKLFPVKEIALVMKDGKRYQMNGAFYKEKQLREMISFLKEKSGVAPTGKLAEYAR